MESEPSPQGMDVLTAATDQLSPGGPGQKTTSETLQVQPTCVGTDDNLNNETIEEKENGSNENEDNTHEIHGDASNQIENQLSERTIKNNQTDQEIKADVQSVQIDGDVPMNVEVSSCNNVTQLFNFTKIPMQLTGSWTEFNSNKDNFFKGCKWAPDGSCILTNSNDGYLRLWNLPEVFFNENKNWDEIPEMMPVLKIREGELIYDYCWYPMMSSTDSATCCLVSTSRNNPIHMFDAYTGELRCTYRPYNHVDEVESAYSVCFTQNGQKLYCGFNKVIRIFDVNIPGRMFEERKLKFQGQTGIISCIAMNPDMKDVYAAGSYLKSIGLYSEPDGNLVCLLQGQQGGITHLMFSPDGTKIYSGGRMDPEILCWDLRNPGSVLYTLQRHVSTNQRIYFDGDSSGRYIMSGGNDGTVSIWDTANIPERNADNETALGSILTYQAHYDCVNGISLHPTMPLLVTSSGQRKFSEPPHSDDDDDSSSDEVLTAKYISFDNSLRLWWVA